MYIAGYLIVHNITLTMICIYVTVGSQPAWSAQAAQTLSRTHPSPANFGKYSPCGRPDDGAAARGTHVFLDRKVGSTDPRNSVWGHLGCDEDRKCPVVLRDYLRWPLWGELWHVPQPGGHSASPHPLPSAAGRIPAENNAEGTPPAGNVGGPGRGPTLTGMGSLPVEEGVPQGVWGTLSSGDNSRPDCDLLWVNPWV